MKLKRGSHLGPYEILELLGAGGMGEVYKARDPRLRRTVAVKVLSERLSQNPAQRERFEREARVIASLHHPHICTVFDIGQQGDTDYLVMEHLEGRTLKGPLPVGEALRLHVQIADALDAAHSRGIVHRDLKPGNVFVTAAGIKLLDFGLAKLLREAEEESTETMPLTREGTVVGTPQYMAPEQLEGRDADARTDIFAFGAVLYEAVTGKRAFEGNSRASLIAALMSSDPPPVSTIEPAAPPALDHVITKCLAKKAGRPLAERARPVQRAEMDCARWLAAGAGRAFCGPPLPP